MSNINKAPVNEIVTPVHGHKVAIKEWITGRDTEAITAIYLGGAKAKPSQTGAVEFQAIDVGAKSAEANHKMIEIWVVAVNGSNENVVDSVLDMHGDDTAFVLQSINELSKKK
jgi:hypothetical protein